MKILALVASQDSTVEDVKTNGRRQMQALIGKDKEVLFCEYSTIEICRNGELAITCLGEKMEKPDYFWPLLGSTDGFILENMLQDAGMDVTLFNVDNSIQWCTFKICVSFRSQEVRLQLIRDLHRMEYGCLIRWCFSKILIPKHCLVVLVIHLL